jgi:hypothetical protein
MSMRIPTSGGPIPTSPRNSVHLVQVDKLKRLFGKEWKKPFETNPFSSEVGP